MIFLSADIRLRIGKTIPHLLLTKFSKRLRTDLDLTAKNDLSKRPELGIRLKGKKPSGAHPEGGRQRALSRLRSVKRPTEAS